MHNRNRLGNMAFAIALLVALTSISLPAVADDPCDAQIGCSPSQTQDLLEELRAIARMREGRRDLKALVDKTTQKTLVKTHIQTTTRVAPREESGVDRLIRNQRNLQYQKLGDQIFLQVK